MYSTTQDGEHSKSREDAKTLTMSLLLLLSCQRRLLNYAICIYLLSLSSK